MTHLGQTRSRHSWEIMMLVVIADVERDPIQRSIIGISFEAFGEHVMFRDEVACHWMDTHGKQGTGD